MLYPVTLPLSSPTALATLHHTSSEVWEFEMHSGSDNRLTASFILNVLNVALDIVEKDWRASTKEAGAPGAFIISGKQDQTKFFSNGFDFDTVAGDTSFLPGVFNPFLARYLTFPIPTVAAMNGHAFAAGFLLALASDYRVMTPGRGWGCMNEIQFGAPLPASFAAVLDYKLSSPNLIRSAALEGTRFTAKDLHALGIVDVIAEDIITAARSLAKLRAPLAKTGVWGLMKKDLMRGMLQLIHSDYRHVVPFQEAQLARSKL